MIINTIHNFIIRKPRKPGAKIPVPAGFPYFHAYNHQHMRKLFLSAVLFLTVAASSHAQDPAEARIRQLMQAQLKAWNKGDIVAFMDTYWKSDSLLFIGSKGLTYGWQATLDNYKKAYPGKEGMGSLAFDLLEFKKLAPDAYFVVGKWKLTRSIGNLSGHFSIILRQIDGEWKIVADHSS